MNNQTTNKQDLLRNLRIYQDDLNTIRIVEEGENGGITLFIKNIGVYTLKLAELVNYYNFIVVKIMLSTNNEIEVNLIERGHL
jgi:hypothetical protein